MSLSEQDPLIGNAINQHEVRPDQNRATRIALATFQEVIHAIANHHPSDSCQGTVARGVVDFQALIADESVSREQEARAIIALTAAGKMVDANTPFPGMVWVREPFRKATNYLRNNGSPVIIEPIGPARKVHFAVIAIPGASDDEGWKLYRREKERSQKGYVMVELPPDSGDSVHLGSDDAQDGIYGFTTLIGYITDDAYAAYIDDYHVTVETAPGDLVVRDHSFLGTSVTHVINEAVPASPYVP